MRVHRGLPDHLHGFTEVQPNNYDREQLLHRGILDIGLASGRGAVTNSRGAVIEYPIFQSQSQRFSSSNGLSALIQKFLHRGDLGLIVLTGVREPCYL